MCSGAGFDRFDTLIWLHMVPYGPIHTIHTVLLLYYGIVPLLRIVQNRILQYRVRYEIRIFSSSFSCSVLCSDLVSLFSFIYGDHIRRSQSTKVLNTMFLTPFLLHTGFQTRTTARHHPDRQSINPDIHPPPSTIHHPDTRQT